MVTVVMCLNLKLTKPARRQEGRVAAHLSKLTRRGPINVFARLPKGSSCWRKNKGTAVFSGDALKTKEITEGKFIVEPLTDGCDGRRNLGDITSNFCGALK